MRCRFNGPAAIFLAFRRVLNGLYVDPVLPIEAQRDFPKNEDSNLNPDTDAEMRIATTDREEARRSASAKTDALILPSLRSGTGNGKSLGSRGP
jgi:hypothetical protein